MMTALVQFESAERFYHLGETIVPALHAVTLQIDAGEFAAVWGPSGSGKSTLCNLAGAIDLPTAGCVRLNGRNIADMADDDRSDHRNRSVGFVFQQFNLIKVLSALENVMLPLELRGEPVSTARRAAEEMLCAVGLSDHWKRRPDRLSGGQQQRVAVARAMAAGAPLLIADEPTANLDTDTALEMIALMRTLNRERGTTFLFSTHDERLLTQVDRKIHLRDGRIVEDVTASPEAAR
jgi:putative ABC transport system ATP-binding protein